MNLIPWKKRNGQQSRELAPLAEFRREMDRLFDSFLRDPFRWEDGGMAVGWPTVDVAESDKEVTVRAEIPGIDPKQLDVSITGNQLVLSGEKKEQKEEKKENFYHQESYYGSFRRSIELPAGVDRSDVKADYSQGVLTIRLKKSPEATPKRVPVKAS